MANLSSFFAFLSAMKKNMREEYDEAINSARASDCRSSSDSCGLGRHWAVMSLPVECCA